MVGDGDVDLEVRVLARELGEGRGEERAEAVERRQAHATVRGVTLRARQLDRVAHGRGGGARRLGELAAGLGDAPARDRTRHAEGALERRDAPVDRRRRGPELARRRTRRAEPLEGLEEAEIVEGRIHRQVGGLTAGF